MSIALLDTFYENQKYFLEDPGKCVGRNPKSQKLQQQQQQCLHQREKYGNISKETPRSWNIKPQFPSKIKYTNFSETFTLFPDKEFN